MALQTYFESLRGTHAEPVKIVLVRDNAAGSVSTDQFALRRSFFLLDFLDNTPQRAESWRSSTSTESSTGSGDSARSILECNDIGGRDDDDGEEFGYYPSTSSPTTARPTKHNPRRRRPVVDRFDFEINGVSAASFARGLPPSLPKRIRSPIFALGKKMPPNERDFSSSKTQIS